MTANKKEVRDVDYLTEDPQLSEQKYMCISFLKPSSIAEKNRPKDVTICGVKIRGSYASYEEAKARADYLQKCDQYHNIYIGEVGKWCPFEDNPEKAKDSEYMNKDLNKLMKSYWNQQTEAKEFHELRKQDMVNKALEDVKTRKNENEAETIIEVENESEEQSDNVKSLSKKKKRTKKKQQLDDVIEQDKIKLDEEKKEIDNNICTLRRLEEELANKIKEMELESAQNILNNSKSN
jgi:hypothetical protein